MADASSRYCTVGYVIDDGVLREDRVTTFLVDYQPLRFRNDPGNVIYTARSKDTLEHLANAFYGTPLLYWVIADYQPEPILNPLVPLRPGRRVVIPSASLVRSTILQR